MDNKKFQEMIDEFTLDSDAIKDVGYDYTVRAISNNYLSMSTDGRFTVDANQEHTAATFSISNAKNLNPATSRVVVYALRKVPTTM